MKKVIGAIGIMAIAIAICFNTSQVNDFGENLSLVGLVAINSANAEFGGEDCDQCVVKKWGITLFSCKSDDDSECSAEHDGITLTCERAKEC